MNEGVPRIFRVPHSRRDVLRAAAVAAMAAGFGSACASEESPTTDPGSTGEAPETTFAEPASKLSGELKILLWSHFVPSHDTWFDKFAQDWGNRTGVKVTVDHVDQAQIPTRIAAEVQAGEGHDLIQYIATLSQYEPSVLDMKDLVDEASSRWGEQLSLCAKSSSNPTTGKFYAYSPGWVPDPGNFRKSLWEPAGFADGPTTWDDLLTGATEIKSKDGIQLGLGMSQEIDSNMVLRALMWSYGASEQDENEKVILDSPETVAAVEFMTKLYKQAMTPEVFSWNAASNNQGLVAGKLSYVVNSISAWRTAQESNPDVADDVHFVPALRGPKAALAAQHVLYNWIVPQHATAPDAAKEFLLHYTANFASATYHSKLYDFCAWDKLTPDRDAWLNDDPFGAKPADKLAFLSDAIPWSANIGHPGPASTAIGEVFNTFVIPNMFARAVRGEASPQESVTEAAGQVNAIFDKWRAQGLVGG
ncbi:MAG: extracellular solute-binding protein [Actinophytocola sp.]|nr:extracellular solute-binding protein [Actinophytocola sp.]